VSTIFEGQEFVLERLFRGSILNYRTFFMEEGAAVQLKFSKASVMQELPYSMMQEISDRFPELNKEFQKYRL
jgi:signal-transduction protein with cAMP-binding, CBS, and nucleotidyltransferase domain